MAENSPRLVGKRIALLAVDGAHEHEFWVPYYRFKEEGATLIVAGLEADRIYHGEGRVINPPHRDRRARRGATGMHAQT